MVSISSLIYKSTRYADSMYNSLMEYTPMLHNGEARFYYVANDASDEVITHLKIKKYLYHVQINPRHSEKTLAGMGIAKPEYLNRVYCGWNRAIKEADDIVVLVSSDMEFSPNWLENLLKHLTPEYIVTSLLIEPKHPKYKIFPQAVQGEHGRHPDTFNKETFLDQVKKLSINKIFDCGAHQPVAFFKFYVDLVGYYPEGNLNCNGNFNEVSYCGDRYWFQRLKKQGIKHITVCDSIVYHYKEGEMDE